jgi:methylmalonyl-CoA mutase N-terminal domain/subunit
MEKIGKASQAWRDEAYSCHKEIKKKHETLSGFAINPLYTPLDLQGWDYLRDLGFPGEAPYVRGGHTGSWPVSARRRRRTKGINFFSARAQRA